MQTTITGRHIDVTEGLKKHIEEKLERLNKLNVNIVEVQVILAVEKDRHIAEILLNAKGLSMSEKIETADMYVSFDNALVLIDERITKYLDKRKSQRIRLRKKESSRRREQLESRLSENEEELL